MSSMKVITTYKTFKIYQVSDEKYMIDLGDKKYEFGSVLKAMVFIDKL